MSNGEVRFYTFLNAGFRYRCGVQTAITAGLVRGDVLPLLTVPMPPAQRAEIEQKIIDANDLSPMEVVI